MQSSDLMTRFCAVRDIAREDWDRLLPGHAADWSYFRAVSDAPPPGFDLGALCAMLDGRVVAVAPTFTTVYRFDTALQSSATLRRFSEVLYRRAPQLVSMKVMSLGAPMCDESHIGLSAELSEQARDAVLRALLARLSARARTEGCRLVAAKGLSGREADDLGCVFKASGYTQVTTIPNVVLELPFSSLQDYLSSLRDGTGAYLKRKWRAAGRVTIEHRASIEGLEGEINALFSATLAQSRVDYGDFSRVHPAYFTSVLRQMGPRARLMLCRVDGELLSFQLYLVGQDEVLAKGIGMKYPKARDYNLYFLNWREMIDYCLRHGQRRIGMSGTTYGTKLLMGGKLDRRWIFFRFNSRILNLALPWLAPAFDYERNDPELRALGAAAPGSSAEKRAGDHA